jgi:hypothetical protein
VTSESTPGTSSSRGPLVIVLAVIGILGIIAGILYLAGAANSLHFMVGSVHKGHHAIRAVVSLVVGVAFLVGAYIARSRPATNRNSAPASGGSQPSGS